MLILSSSLLLSVKVIGVSSFHDDFLAVFLPNRELPAVRIMAHVAARIVRDNVVKEIFIAGVAELMRFPRSKEKRISGSHLGPATFVTNFSATRNNEIHFRFDRMRMIRAKRFPFWNGDESEIERPPLRRIK